MNVSMRTKNCQILYITLKPTHPVYSTRDPSVTRVIIAKMSFVEIFPVSQLSVFC